MSAPAHIQPKIQALKGIIWDLDNTLYTLTDTIEGQWNWAYARYFASLPHLPYDEQTAFKLAETSYNETGYSAAWFIKQHDLCPRETHRGVHQHMCAEQLAACDTTQRLFASHPNLSHAVVTHGSRDWALRALARLGLQDFIPETYVIGLEDADFETKRTSPRGLHMAMDRLGLGPDKLMFVEDLAENLVIPKRHGLTTCLLTQGRPIKTEMAHIDWVTTDARQVLSSISAAKALFKYNFN